MEPGCGDIDGAAGEKLTTSRVPTDTAVFTDIKHVLREGSSGSVVRFGWPFPPRVLQAR